MSGFVDRIARRPSGFWGWLFYRFPMGHKAGFDLALDRLPPDPKDLILEVGCGGGVFLRRLLESGCRAEAVDHSPDMLRDTARLNAGALREGRLTLQQGDAAQLPVATGGFDKVYCLNAFFFFPDPAAAVAEMARALRPGGQLAIITAGPDTAPQIRRFSTKMADAMQFHPPEYLADLCRAAGLEPAPLQSASHAGYLMLARRPDSA